LGFLPGLGRATWAAIWPRLSFFPQVRPFDIIGDGLREMPGPRREANRHGRETREPARSPTFPAGSFHRQDIRRAESMLDLR
jgi:hypothetical protein